MIIENDDKSFFVPTWQKSKCLANNHPGQLNCGISASGYSPQEPGKG
jgi:hypothetical protein